MVWEIILYIAILSVVVVTLYGFIIGAPIFFTPETAFREALEFCQIRPGSHFCDLGAGTGRTMIMASREFGLKTSGFELSPILYFWAWLNIHLHGAKNCRLFCHNFYNHDFSQEEVVFCFLTPSALVRLKPKLEKELRPGTLVISYSFSFPQWEPLKIIKNQSPGKMFIYRIGS